MQVLSINPYNYQQTSFGRRGKPIDLKYIVENRSNLLPPRILRLANEVLRQNPPELPSLKTLHMAIYGPLLRCESLAEVKEIYPEFEGIRESVTFARDSVYKREFEEKTKHINFPLKMLQELWINLKTKDEIARELGMTSRSSIDWALKQIGFVYYPPNYRTLINASDKEGNRIIAQKTTAYNQAHPEQMYERNRHAAQFCKTEEYRAAQRARIIQYDILHPERREKISEFDKRVWELCPDIKELMSNFAAGETPYVRNIVMKKTRGGLLTEQEKRVSKGFYKRFWAAYPECREILAAAKKQVREEMKTKKRQD